MAIIFIKESVDDKLSKKTTVIPQYINKIANMVKNQYGNNRQQDGYKIINRLIDSEYNKKGKNNPKVDNNDGLAKFPTSSARKMINSLKKSKDFINPKAKNTIINYLDTDVKSKENAIRNNNFVPKVPKLAKSASEVDTKKVKPNLVTSPSTVVESKKKFIFTKRQIKLRNPNLL